jgi:DNA-directed RNA polymerase specialized sigma24 family protein
VVRAKRELLLRAHRNRLRREDLEDCYSQAALELVAHACKGGAFWSRVHVGNVLEQRFLSRINDRRRALSGRSPMQAALEGAVSIGAAGESAIEVADVRAELEALVMLRHDLGRIERLARENLTGDQRLVLASQVGLPLSTRDFCHRFGWSQEKYRKVAQRARRRLRALMAADELVAAGRAGPSARRTPPMGRRSPTERRPSKRPGRE